MKPVAPLNQLFREESDAIIFSADPAAALARALAARAIDGEFSAFAWIFIARALSAGRPRCVGLLFQAFPTPTLLPPRPVYPMKGRGHCRFRYHARCEGARRFWLSLPPEHKSQRIRDGCPVGYVSWEARLLWLESPEFREADERLLRVAAQAPATWQRLRSAITTVRPVYERVIGALLNLVDDRRERMALRSLPPSVHSRRMEDLYREGLLPELEPTRAHRWLRKLGITDERQRIALIPGGTLESVAHRFAKLRFEAPQELRPRASRGRAANSQRRPQLLST